MATSGRDDELASMAMKKQISQPWCGPSTRPCRNKGVSVSPSGVSFSPSGVSFSPSGVSFGDFRQGILPRDTVSSTRRCCILRGPRASTAAAGGTAAAGSGAGHLYSHQYRHCLQRRGPPPPAPAATGPSNSNSTGKHTTHKCWSNNQIEHVGGFKPVGGF